MEIWINIANTAGSIVVVVLFLRYLQASDKQRSETTKQSLDRIEQIGDSCHEHSQKLTQMTTASVNHAAEVISNNTVVMSRVEKVLDQQHTGSK